MCIIIYKPNAKKIKSHIRDNSIEKNPDGMGFLNLENPKKPTLLRTMSLDRMEEELDRKTPFIAHLRYATVGKICKENTHPVKFKGGYLFMNGTINGFHGLTRKGDETDTSKLAECLNLFSSKKDIIEFLSKFEARFLIYWNDKKVTTVGEWVCDDGTYYSKKNVLEVPKKHKPYSGVALTNNSKTYLDSSGAVPLDSSLVAVYGTLKQIGGNHYRYLKNAEWKGNGVILAPHRMIDVGCPIVFANYNQPSNVKKGQIQIEVYKVTPKELAEMDKLEGHPHHYRRRPTAVLMYNPETNQEQLKTVWVYMYDTEDKGTKKLPHIDCWLPDDMIDGNYVYGGFQA